jgi:hypothetical protein
VFLLSLLSVSEDEEWWSEPSIALAFPVVATFLHLREMQRRLESAGEENEGVDEEEGGVHLLPALIRAHVQQHLQLPSQDILIICQKYRGVVVRETAAPINSTPTLLPLPTLIPSQP